MAIDVIIIANTAVSVAVDNNGADPITFDATKENEWTAGAKGVSLQLAKGQVGRVLGATSLKITGDAQLITDPQKPPVPPFKDNGKQGLSVMALLEGKPKYP
jgi:hypothetical protein